MSATTYAGIMRVVVVVLAALIAAAVVLELPLYIPVLAVAFVLVVASLIRRRVREIMADERDVRIQERATDLSYRIFTISAAVVSLVALMLRSRLPSWAGIAGETLAYAVCALMLIHLAATGYFRSRL